MAKTISGAKKDSNSLLDLRFLVFVGSLGQRKVIQTRFKKWH